MKHDLNEYERISRLLADNERKFRTAIYMAEEGLVNCDSIRNILTAMRSEATKEVCLEINRGQAPKDYRKAIDVRFRERVTEGM